MVHAQTVFGTSGDEELVWEGDTEKFTFGESTLSLNDESVSSPAVISTETVRADSLTTWNLTATLEFAPSTQNYARFFLAADSTINNGVVIFLGKSISIESYSGGSATKLATSDTTITSSSSNTVNLNIVRTISDDDYVYTLTIGYDNDEEETLTASVDGLWHEGMTHMALRCVYTKTRIDKMHFSGLSVEEGFEPFAPIVTTDTTSRGSVVINEFMPKNSDEYGLPDAEYIELKNMTSTNFALENWTISNGKTTGKLPSYTLMADSIVVLVSSSKASAFASATGVTVISPSSWPTITNSSCRLILADSYGTVADFVDYTEDMLGTKDKGYSLERLDGLNLSNRTTNWQVSDSEQGGTPGKENSVQAANADADQPALSSATVSDDGSLLTLIFDEPMDTSAVATSFSFDGVQIEAKVTETDSVTLQTLVFSLAESLREQYVYSLAVDGFKDLAGNAMTASTTDVSIGGFTWTDTLTVVDATSRGSVVINEFMPKPSDAYGLPDAEYIELKNMTSANFALENWTISNGKTTGKLPSYTLMADSVVVLVTSSKASAFASATGLTVISPSTWPAITNSSCRLILSNSEGTVIDFVDYTESMLGTKDEGYSMERIDGLNLSNRTTNWQVSDSEQGGTPGKENSVAASNADTDQPALSSATVSDDGSLLTLLFDEPMDTSAVATSFSFDGVQIEAKVNEVDSVTLQTLVFSLAESLREQYVYSLAVDGFKDLAGNAMTASTTDVSIGGFAWTDTLTVVDVTSRGSVVINEFMPKNSDEYGLPDAEYIELKNMTSANFALENWTISNGKTTGKLPSYTLMADSIVVLVSSSKASAFASATGVTVISPSSWPTITNSSCRLILADSYGTVADFVDYTEDMLGDTYKNDGGFSVERIDGLNLSNRTTNWQVSDSEQGGTPGKENSVQAANADTDQPALSSATVSDDGSLLTLLFDEPMDTSAVATSFSFDGVQIEAKVNEVDSVTLQTLVFSLSEPIQRQRVYQMEIAGFFDLAGNEVPTDNLRLGIPEEPAEGDVIINEVMFNGDPSSNDYVEIYNLSDKIIDLSKLYYGTVVDDQLSTRLQIASSKRSFFPGDYFVFSKDSTAIDEAFGPLDLSLLASVSGMNTLSDDATIALALQNGQIIESLTYSSSMLGYAAQTEDNVSLERIRTDLPASETTNWSAASVDYGYATPTERNSQCRDGVEQPTSSVELVSKVFTPDGDGVDDELIIRTQFDDGGWLATLRVFSSAGVSVAMPYNNEAVAVSGELRWDGKADDGSTLAPGTYILHISMWQQGGSTQEFKKTCVISTTPR